MKLIYCVEDDNSLRELLTCALKTVNYEVSSISDYQVLKEKLKKSVPDLILLDIMLHEEDGTAILQTLKNDKRYMDIPVIILVAASSVEVKVKLLDLGADDVVTKPFGMLELIARLNAVLRIVMKTAAGQKHMECNGIFLDYNKREIRYESNYVSLSNKEFELFYYLVMNKGIVLSRDKMIDKIWGCNYKGEKRAVNMYISSIRRKLGEAGCHDIIKTVRSAGFIIEDK
ncbi:response regulator transcription factor [Sedimentibacter sp. B4]|uniref:response regulator transcription factor n=1 Tax=Sedimentibacter sp. B4 TaxID=304766 RepID=UPI0002F5ECFF|nr:response regulator transcription factor [Sedimentibacter sp. B4]